MTIHRPLISVIIPSFNRSEIVKEAIESVLNQTYKNFELLIVDDHSTDNTKEVVDKYQDKRVRYLINVREKGAQGARNTGLYSAKGEWVAMLDSDDAWLKEKLEKQVEYLKSAVTPIIGVSCGHALFDFDRSLTQQTRIPESNTYSTKDLLYKNYLGGFSTFLFKREMALEVGGFDERFPAMQDMDFYISLSKKGEIHSLKEILVNTRVDNLDRISTNYENKYYGALLFHEKNQNLFDLNLKNRSYSRIILYSYKYRLRYFFKYIHWFFLGIVLDYSNFKWLFKEMIGK